MADLYRRSIEILLENQHEKGSFPADPEFGPYRYAWLRDGTFCAYALDLVGEYDASSNFYQWVGRTLSPYLGHVENLNNKRAQALRIGEEEFLHTRFTLAGEQGTEPWGNFQLDGYGAYLWGLAEHLQLAQDEVPLEDNRLIVLMVIKYLRNFWVSTCLDCWEENDNHLHPSTLAAVYGGLQAIKGFYPELHLNATLEAIKAEVLHNFMADGHLVKTPGSNNVDASLLWVSTPFKLLQQEDPLMLKTAAVIEQELAPAVGVHRYQGDTYYGGGQWILLTAWLGWYYCQIGQKIKGKKYLQWVENQADAEGYLPEQVNDELYSPGAYYQWQKRWGKGAKKLLWSQAMYLVLKKSLDDQ